MARPYPTLWLAAALLIDALSLGPSFAHVLEAPPRLSQWPPELWREATVFNGQFQLFAIVGGPLDILAILAPAVLALLLWRRGFDWRPAAAAAALYGVGLLVWTLWVASTNAELATWTRGPLPPDFAAVRDRWESGHAAVAAVKLLGFASLALFAARGRRDQRLES